MILLGGQSNSVGQALSPKSAHQPGWSTIPPNRCPLFYDGNASLATLQPGSGGNPWPSAAFFGPEISFSPAIADAPPSATYAIIKHGENGTALYNDWDPATGSSYSNFRDTVTDGLAALQAAGHTTEIVGMVWDQGDLF
ncbi:sialate O-acetylesterase [Akkermansiaceae bacterium]|nr:sialate O-acetylesterase [Akkermansiaceae bacterium]MDA7888047.1 sialate O-acetylesterase [Akkermansiaceae bacterium]